MSTLSLFDGRALAESALVQMNSPSLSFSSYGILDKKRHRSCGFTSWHCCLYLQTKRDRVAKQMGIGPRIGERRRRYMAVATEGRDTAVHSLRSPNKLRRMAGTIIHNRGATLTNDRNRGDKGQAGEWIMREVNRMHNQLTGRIQKCSKTRRGGRVGDCRVAGARR